MRASRIAIVITVYPTVTVMGLGRFPGGRWRLRATCPGLLWPTAGNFIARSAVAVLREPAKFLLAGTSDQRPRRSGDRQNPPLCVQPLGHWPEPLGTASRVVVDIGVHQWAPLA